MGKEAPPVTDATPPTDDQAQPHPMARVLRVLGVTLFIPAVAIVLLSEAAAWSTLDLHDLPVTEMGLAVAAAAYPALMMAVVLLAVASLLEARATGRWRSVGGWTTKAVGVGALSLGVVLLTVALVSWGVSKGEAGEALFIAARLARVGAPFLVGGALLLAAGHAVASRVTRRGVATADGGLAAAIVVVGFVLANPWAVGVDLEAATVPFQERYQQYNEEDRGPVEVLWFNGTIRAGTRPGPYIINGPGSEAVHEFTANGSGYVVVEVQWNASGGPEHLDVSLEQYANGGWHDVERVNDGSPIRIQASVTPGEEYRVRVFLGDDGDVQPEVNFQEAVSLFDRYPPEDYTALAGAA